MCKRLCGSRVWRGGRSKRLHGAEMTIEFTDPNENSSHAEPRNGISLLVATLLNLAIVGLVTIAMVPLTDVVPPVAALALYFVPVLLATRLWNFEQGIIAAFASGLLAAYFFFKPVFSFHVADRADVLALLIFLATAILAGYLLDEARRHHRAARIAAHMAADGSAAGPDLHPVLHFGSGARTVPERVAEFLVTEAVGYCDQCIQDQLGLKWRQQVQLVTATLAVTTLFQRNVGECGHCNQSKQVIQHVAPKR